MLRQFYEDALPRHGHLCLFTLPGARHHWASTIDELVTLTTQFAAKNPTHELYFATAGFKSRDRHALNADGMRCLRVDLDAGAEKLAKHGPDAVYATQRDAVVALLHFVTDTKLVPTWIVSSGMGLHVYWSLAQDIEPREWQPLADALKDLCRLKGLKADPSVTADAARVLRPIETIHVKSGSRVTAIKHTARRWSSAELRAALGAHVDVAAPGQRRYQGSDPFGALGPTRVLGDTSINADAMPAYEPSNATLVADQCAVMRAIRASGGQVAEPLWRAMLGVVKFTTQGEEAAHKWSEGDARYSWAETQRKYEAWAAGPTTCKHISEHSDLCRTCPHAGKITTPVELGRARAPEVPLGPAAKPYVPQESVQLPTDYNDWVPPPLSDTPWEGYLPDGYFIRVKDGDRVLVKRVPAVGDDGKAVIDYNEITGLSAMRHEDKTISHEPMWFTGWSGAETNEDRSVIEYKTLRRNQDLAPKTFIFELARLSSNVDMLKELLNKGVSTKEDRLMRGYVLDSINMIKALSNRPRVADRMGVRYLDDGAMVAVHGRHVIYPDRTIRGALIASNVATIASNFSLPLADSPTGMYDRSAWSGIEARARHYTAFLAEHMTHPKLQLAIALALASPLLAFVSDGSYTGGAALPGTGLTVSLFSQKTARGKTTAAKVAMLAYGHPDELTGHGAAIASTEIARTTRMSQHGTMPMFVDEIGQGDAKRVAELVDIVANGSARSRGNKDGGVNISIPWALITLITTNVSARMMVNSEQEASNAIQSRLLEINVDDVPDHNAEQNAHFRDDWSRVNGECHGTLGAIVYRELVALPMAERAKLESACLQRARAILHAEQSGRFVYRAMAAMFMLYVLLERAAISLPFPIKPLLDEFKVAYDAGLEFALAHTISNDPCSVLALFVHDNVRNTLVTNTLAVNRFTSVAVLSARIPDNVYVRYARDSRILLVSVPAFKDWCRARGLEVSALVKGLASAGVVERSNRGGGLAQWYNKRNLLNGVAAGSPGQIEAFVIDVAKLEEVMGGEVEIPSNDPPPGNVRPLTA